MSDLPPPAPQGNRSIIVSLAVGLVLSLAINTFFIGIAVGSRATSERWIDGLRERLGAEQGAPHPEELRGLRNALDPRRLGRALPESAHEDARAIMEANERDLRAAFGAAMRAKMESFEAIQANPFDPVALDAALARSRAADTRAAEIAHAVTSQILAGLTEEEREAVQAALLEEHPRLSPDARERRRERRERREERRERWRDRDGGG